LLKINKIKNLNLPPDRINTAEKLFMTGKKDTDLRWVILAGWVKTTQPLDAADHSHSVLIIAGFYLIAD
jgi:glucose-6-phosphate dehydrogenase assembly protein OpcA